VQSVEQIPSLESFIICSGATVLKGKIIIPESIKKIKIDIGLSGNAPQSKEWIEADPEILIFGFEPLSINLKMISQGSSIWPSKLNPEFIGRKIFILPVALYSKTLDHRREMKITDKDSGSSSLLDSTDLKQSTSEYVPVFKLDDFLEFVDFKKHNFIEHIKIDAQGMDFEIIRGVKKHLKRVSFVTAELDQNYLGTTNNLHRLNFFMRSHGFIKIGSVASFVLQKVFHCKISVDDPTYFNLRAIRQLNKSVFIYQKG